MFSENDMNELAAQFKSILGSSFDEKALGGKAFIPRDGDGDGFFSPAPKAPDETPISKLPEAMAKIKDEDLLRSLKKRQHPSTMSTYTDLRGKKRPLGNAASVKLFNEQVDSYAELRRRGMSESDLKKISPRGVADLGERKFRRENNIPADVKKPVFNVDALDKEFDSIDLGDEDEISDYAARIRAAMDEHSDGSKEAEKLAEIFQALEDNLKDAFQGTGGALYSRKKIQELLYGDD